MASWKKVIVSGSSAHLDQISGSTGLFSGALTAGSFVGTLSTNLTDGNGIADFTYNGSSAASIALDLDGSTLALGSGGVKVADAGITGTQIATSVAGDGLTGGGGSALAVGAGTGIDVSSNAIAVDVSDFMSSGVNNRILTATGTDAFQGESKLTFDGAELLVAGTISSSGDIHTDGVIRVSGSAQGHAIQVLGNVSASGHISASAFIGDGSSLSGISADSTTGTLSVDNVSLQLNSGTQFDGSADRTISIKANGVNVDQLNSAVAGDGLTGGAGSALAVGAGTGIDVSSDAIAVDVSDFMTNGSNNRLVTATGTDAMNAEANLTFDGSTLTVTGDTSISGDLFVGGDTVTVNASNLNIEDKFILLNSGSTSGDGGVIVQTGANGIGTAIFYDDSLKRWGLTIEDGATFNATAEVADYHLGAVSASAGAPTGNPYGFGTNLASRIGLMVVDTDSSDIYIYS